MKKQLLFLTLIICSNMHAWFWFGSNKNKQQKENFLVAAKNDQVRQLYDLIDEEADINTADENGKTALMWACENGCRDTVHILLTYNTDVNLQESMYGSSALFYAAQRGDEATVKKLIMSGARMNIKNKEGQTPLHIASYFGCTRVVELLIFAGADPNVLPKVKHGKTPLMYAARNGHADIAKLLLEGGADVNAQTTSGKTALIYSTTHGHPDVTRVLLSYNAKIDIKDKKGKDAVFYTSHDEIKNVLLRAF